MIVKKDVMSTKSLWKIDLSDKSADVILPKDLKFQLSLKLEVRKVTLTEKEMLDFKHDCIKIVRAICQKMLDESPIKYKICQEITFCDPSLIAEKLGEREQAKNPLRFQRLDIVLKAFTSWNWISGLDEDKITKEFKSLCANTSFLEAFKLFHKDVQRLDHFWSGLVADHKCSDRFWSFLKKVLILSQGNAFIERSFSLNKEVIVKN